MMDENMLRMQREAVERVRQMQERARKYVENDGHFKEEKQQADQDKTGKGLKPDLPENKLSAEKPGLIKKKSPSFLDGLWEDSEQLFLLMLAVLLVRNDAPIELVLALLYIAM